MEVAKKRVSNLMKQLDQDNQSFKNATSLITVSQMRGFTRNFSIFRKYLIEIGLTEKQISLLYSCNIISQTLGFFSANKLSRIFGIKTSLFLGSFGVAIGLSLSGIFIKKRIPLIISLSLVSSSIGFIERISYKSIVENYFENGKLFLSLYLGLSSLSSWISILNSYLLSKVGLSNTYFISSLIVLFSLPLLSFLSVKELFGEKNSKSFKISIPQIFKKFLTDIKFISYIIILLVISSIRSMLHSQGSNAIETCLNLSPIQSTLFSEGIGSIIPFITRIFFGRYLRKSSVMELTTSLLTLQIISLLGLLSNHKMIFTTSMILLYSCLALCHPLSHVFKNSLEIVDRKVFNELQSIVVIVGSFAPLFTSFISEKYNVKGKMSYKVTFGIHLLWTLFAGWLSLLIG